MRYVLDTNIVSEFLKPDPNQNVIWWAQDYNADLLLNVISIQELYFGIFTMPDGKKKTRLRESLDAIVRECTDRILPFDAFAGYLCAEMHASAKAAGHPRTIEDLMIAAICKRNDAVLTTRNIKDFDCLGIELIDPFEYESDLMKELRCREM